MISRKWIVAGIGGVFLVACAGIIWWAISGRISPLILSPLSSTPLKEKPLEKYTIENLTKRTYVKSPIVFGEPVATTSSYTAIPFSFTSDGKKVTGLAHLPAGRQVSQFQESRGKFPVIVQLRGFADRETYVPGLGTKHSAEVYASNGFVSLAPDFLGYGGSDAGSKNVFEDRFETYTTTLNLLASVSTVSFVDPAQVFLWGHSNGGQIALTVLTVLGEKGTAYPTSLWAPVTKIFPYSILYYTDEFEDYGKAFRKELATFEKDYDTDTYAFIHYLDRIQTPIIFHQGTDDEAVPIKWSNDFVNQLKEKGKTVRYYTYPGADHNLSTGWNTAVSRDVEFFRSFLR